jgi:lipoprotein signal peptidase
VGWITVAAIIAVLLVTALYLVLRATQRWWDLAIILILTGVLMPLLYRLVTGDVSAWVRVGWSEGIAGKDQIIVASAASSILLPLVLAAGLLVAVKRIASQARGNRRS